MSTTASPPKPQPTSQQSSSSMNSNTSLNSPTANRSNTANAQRIGPYILGKTLGVGSTGRVKLGTHLETKKMVAIKIIPKDSLTEKSENGKPISPEKRAAMNKKIEREITIMKLIQHPNVMQLYDVYETDKELQHIEGGELFDYLVKRGRLSENEALMFFQQIIFGVEFCHKHLICHRDLKPENLLLDRDLNVKIADFGMASIQGPGRISPHYASPEIIKGIKYDGPAADIWSCGVILYALLTGNLPFDDENIRRLLSKVKAGMYFIPDHVSPQAKDLIKRMLVIDPEKRITMKEVMRHPWFALNPPKNGDQVLPSAMEDHSLSRPLEDATWADMEVIQSLELLGWGEHEEIVSNLMSPQPNTVKIFYNLLCRRKWSFFENYDVRKLGEWDVEGGPKRRAESYSSLPEQRMVGSRMDIYRSDANMLGASSSDVSKPKELRKSNEELRKPEDVIANRPRTQSANSATSTPVMTKRQIADSLKPRINTVTSASVKVNSPLSNSTTAENNLNVGPHSPKVPASPTLEHRAGIPPTPTHIEQGVAKLSISIPNTKSEGQPTSPLPSDASDIQSKPNISPMIGLSTGSPRFHRKKQEIPPTPTISTQPKRSWFANLLNFKPEVFTFNSVRSLEETNTFFLEKFQQFEVKFQLRKEGGFKCKYSGSSTDKPSRSENSSANNSNSNSNSELLSIPAPSSPSPGRPSHASERLSTSNSVNSPLSPSPATMTSDHFNFPMVAATTTHVPVIATKDMAIGKSCKFKIDISAEEVGEGAVQYKITFIHQQGSFSTFQVVVNKFKSCWILNQASPQVASS